MKKNRLLPGMFFVLVLAVSLAPVAMATYTVLWDTSNGVLSFSEVGYGSGFQPSGYYGKLSDFLTANDFSVNTTTSAFNSTNLAGVDVAVVAVPSSYNSAYSAAEIEALATFVGNGGGLLIMGDTTTTPIGNINPLASEFGIEFGPANIDFFDFSVTDFPNSHDIFGGISQVSLYGASEITLSGSAVEVATYDSKTAIAVSEYGLGRVVAIGDSSLWAWGGNGGGTNFDLSDNEDFALNTFEYLAVPEPATLVILGIGGLVVTARKRSKQS